MEINCQDEMGNDHLPIRVSVSETPNVNSLKMRKKMDT